MEKIIEALKAEIEALRKSNVLWGKSLVICGDSFSEGDFTHWGEKEGENDRSVIYDEEMKMYKTYPWWIAKRNNMKLTNLAKCGGTIAITKAHLEDPENVPKNTRNPFSLDTYKNLGDDVDYILIMYGLNDGNRSNLGSIDDETNETFYGAFNVVYKYLIEKYPTAKIGAIVSNGSMKKEFADAVREVSVKWGIPYLDLQRDASISATLGKEGMCEEAIKIRNAQFKVNEKNGHPNVLAHEFMSTYVEDFLRRI